jgi:hypothetical protein
MRLSDHRLGLGDTSKVLCLGQCNNHTIVQAKTQAGILGLAPERWQDPRRLPYGSVAISATSYLTGRGASVRKCHRELELGMPRRWDT